MYKHIIAVRCTLSVVIATVKMTLEHRTWPFITCDAILHLCKTFNSLN